MTHALNEQLNKEAFSAYLYLSMSAYCSYTGLKGAANWFMVQTKEEMIHANKFYDYLNSQGAKVTLLEIKQPESNFESLKDMFEKALKHEKFITTSINDLVSLADEEKDNATSIFLDWFVTEQIEEEESVNEILSKLKLAGDGGSGLFMIDNELSTRSFS